jgi:hypothetical protein
MDLKEIGVRPYELDVLSQEQGHWPTEANTATCHVISDYRRGLD